MDPILEKAALVADAAARYRAKQLEAHPAADTYQKQRWAAGKLQAEQIAADIRAL